MIPTCEVNHTRLRLALALTVTVVLSACGGGGEPEPDVIANRQTSMALPTATEQLELVGLTAPSSPATGTAPNASAAFNEPAASTATLSLAPFEEPAAAAVVATLDSAGGDAPQAAMMAAVVRTESAKENMAQMSTAQPRRGMPTVPGLVTFDESVVPALSGFAGAEASSIGLDPADTGNRVGKVVKSASAASWAGTVLMIQPVNTLAPIAFSAANKTMSVRIWSPLAKVAVRLKVENADGSKTADTEATVTTAAGWQTLQFNFGTTTPDSPPLDLSVAYVKVVIFFNFGRSGVQSGGARTYYFDNVTFPVQADASETRVWGSNFTDGLLDWPSIISNWGASNRSFASVPGITGQAMNVFMRKGSIDPGTMKARGLPVSGQGIASMPLSTGLDAARLTYKIRLPSDFKPGLGGKLPGLCGGACNGGGTTPNGYDGFSARLMWNENGRADVYAYLPSSVNYGTHLGIDKIPLARGAWTTIVQDIILNTVGQADGRIRVRANGVLVVDQQGVVFRHTNNLKINGVFFDVFFGGSSDAWAAPQDTTIQFAEFAINSL